MESDKFKLGLFLVISFIVICTLFAVFGLFDVTSNKVDIYTTFRESVQGLESGSMVKLRGVPIGKVTDITIGLQDKMIRVDMSIDLDKLRLKLKKDNFSDGASISENEFYSIFRTEIESGLRMQIAMGGITGMRYIETDYSRTPLAKEQDELFEASVKKGFHRKFYVPSQPSMISDFRNKIANTLEKLANIDYKAISEDIMRVLNSADKMLTDPKIAETIRNVEDFTKHLASISASLEQALPEEKMQKIVQETTETLEVLKTVPPMFEKALKEAQIQETAGSFRDAANSVKDSRAHIETAIVKINALIDSISELVKLLDENPQVLIHGKQ